jgi:hypothetical protein
MGFLDDIEPPTPPPLPFTGPRVPPSTSYAAAALRDELNNVANAAEGQRNQTLVASAFSLRSLITAGTLDEATVINDLYGAARAAGLDDREIETTIRSGFAGSDAKVGARTVPERQVTPAHTVNAVAEPQSPRLSQFGSRLLTPHAIRNMPEPEPLIGNVLNRGTTALLYGKWGTSKSFIALDWACSLATGRRWQDRTTEKVKVLYVVAEGAAGFAGRLDAWETAWRTKVGDGAMKFLPVPVNLMSRDVDLLVEEVKSSGFEFIVFDTLARCTVGAEENSARDVGIVIDSMTRIVDATPDHRGAVLGVHHTGKDAKTLRGSSAYEGGVDTVYFVERDNHIHLRCQKQKDGPDNDRHTLRLAQIDGTGSCVVEGVSGVSVEDEAASVELLKKIFTEMFSETGVSSSELRNVAVEQGMSHSLFYRARGELMRDGWITSTGSGPRGFFEVSAGRTESQ